MGDILPFIAKVRSSGEWSATERARLEELADRFAAAGVKVEVVYGASEDGDPWCVVKDADEEILVHVARIGGAFVVHSAIDDALREGQDLRSALGERLSWAEPDERVVVPFGRHAQTFLALLVATAFFYDTAAAPAPDEPHHAALPEPDATPAPAVADAIPAVDKRELAQHAGVLGTTDDPAPRPAEAASWAPEQKAPAPFAVQLAVEDKPAAPAHAAAPPAPQVQAAPAVQRAQAETPGVRLTGGAGADHLVGTAGDDTLSGGGAPKGGHDLLDGAEGNDRIELGAQVIAIGGSGADTFVIVAPAQPDHADTLLGVVLDFHLAEGDKLVTAQGRQVTLRPTADPSVTVNVDGDGFTTQTFVTGRRVEVDLDGDGKPDGYVLVADPEHADPSGITAVGQGLSHPDPFG